MKFVCITCDSQMKLDRTLPPDGDAISAVFACPTCGASFAMHTNSMETQLVKSLGVKIGGPTGSNAPMETVRGSLAGAKELSNGSGSTGDDQPPLGNVPDSTGGKCPFTGVVNEVYGGAAQEREGPIWTEGASARLERVPSFIRPMVKRGIEDVARTRGYAKITEAVMAKVREEIGM